MIRSFAVFGVAGGIGAVALQVTADTARVLDRVEPERSYSLGATPLSAYSLSHLELLKFTLDHVEENYVEPGRVDYERMYAAALDAVERRVPVTMFRREPGGSMLHVEIGDHRTVLEVGPIGSGRQLYGELMEVAALLEDHLLPTDIPDPTPGALPYADIEYALVNGVLSTLDPHSVLLPPVDSREMDVENQGEFGGLGISLVERDGHLTVEYPLPDTPAWRLNIQPGDRIVRIDGETTINMSLDEAVERLRGEVGSRVVVEIAREGEPETLEFVIQREKIPLKPVEAELLDGAIGYVYIQSFHAGVEADLHEKLTRLTREAGALKGLILDLRGNPGGYLTQSVAVADTFLDKGMIVAQVDGTGERDGEENARAPGTEPFYPMVVLVNGSSASASEIVAGALRNGDRAVIVGERTFGKGSVQNLHALDDGSKLKLTISKYLTPGDRSIQSVGIPADIEMVPVIAEWREEDGRKDPYALVYWRERFRREADLDEHLENAEFGFDEPAWTVRYLRPAEVKRRAARLDLSSDQEVQFARDLLLVAPSWRRGEILAAVEPVVARQQVRGERDIEAAFERLAIDWSPGAPPEHPSLDVAIDLGPDGQLVAGQEEWIGLEVTNRGSEPVYRVVAVSDSPSDLLDGREFVFGRIDPGETRRVEQRVRFVEGAPAEIAPVTFELRDARGVAVATEVEQVPVEARELPRFAWGWTFDDAAPGGDGDGVAEPSETLRLRVSVTNIGAGPTGDPFVRIKNKAGPALDFDRGSLTPGTVRDGSGVACAPDGEESGEPTWPEGCEAVLRPGETWAGDFAVTVVQGASEPLALELTLGDGTAYDQAAVARAGFFEFFSNSEIVEIPVGRDLPQGPTRTPPRIGVTRAPGTLADADLVTVSGVVTDDTGVSWVMAWHDEDKVFYDGSGRHGDVRSVPFTATLELEPGPNTIVVLARDVDGHTSTRSVVTWRDEPEKQARLVEPP